MTEEKIDKRNDDYFSIIQIIRTHGSDTNRTSLIARLKNTIIQKQRNIKNDQEYIEKCQKTIKILQDLD